LAGRRGDGGGVFDMPPIYRKADAFTEMNLQITTSNSSGLPWSYI